ncbi:response regulator, partial [Enterocloster bolteae]
MPKFSVLIIEDEKNIQTFMGKVLKRHDYQVLYADTGKQGLEMIRSRCPDLILLDL